MIQVPKEQRSLIPEPLSSRQIFWMVEADFSRSKGNNSKVMNQSYGSCTLHIASCCLIFK